ncbi:MAG: hypothetical protein Q7V63_09770 [Gammaproteobacteria bacterium]|nr:hypothetical protein [Gammaproteobacteria bacterium]
MAAGAKPRIGIISGAGPMAGISLLKQIIVGCQKRGAWKDADFPEIHLLSFPFSDMLSVESKPEKVRAELAHCIKQLENHCEHILIACNTLHLFLPEPPPHLLVHLISLIKSRLPKNSKPLILASLSSATENLHGRLLGIECEYWDPIESQKTIDAILKGQSPALDWILDLAKTRTLILGCTEYSLAFEDMPSTASIIDPLKLACEYCVNLSYPKLTTETFFKAPSPIVGELACSP